MEFKQFLLGLLICFFLSFLLGIERQYRRRLLGLRTMILVSVGSYLFVSFSFLISGYQTDVSRIAAQVVAGIGFLGAGVIIKDSQKSKVKGLTTAATLWCDASIGILCAGGFIKEAIVASLVVLFANVILRYFNVLINSKVREKSIIETFVVSMNVSVNKVNEIKDDIITYIDKVDFLETNSYVITKGKLTIELNVRKSDLLKFDKYINKVVSTYNIDNYQIKKMSESILEDTEEL